MVRAGHCGPTGVLWYQGYYDGSKILTTGTMATANTIQSGDNRTDSELIGGESGSLTPYRGPID